MRLDKSYYKLLALFPGNSVFDCFQYAKQRVREDLVTCMTLGTCRHEVVVPNEDVFLVISSSRTRDCNVRKTALLFGRLEADQCKACELQ